nr:retrovirus-related Pol polyprotein from transposon TNT 1-94 [Tanacetum cinerariifolium]
MDSIIPLGYKNTLVEYMTLSGANNRPPMLDKDLYDLWKSRMKLYMQNREHGRMILKLVEHGLLIWPTVEVNGVTRTKKYVELSAAEKIQADCDMKATNIILQGFVVPVFSPGDNPIACLNKAMDFLTVVASLRFLSTNNQLRTSSNPRNQATIQNGMVTVRQVQGRQGQSYSGTGYKSNATSSGGNNASRPTRVIKCYNCQDLDTYDSDCDDISNAQAVLMPNISNYGTLRFGNDHIARIKRYGDYQLGNVTISTTLREFYENVGISHQTSVARTLQQNGVVERRNQTLIEAAHTMLIFSKALLFLLADAINTACYTQNCSLILLRYNKTPYELMQDKKLDLSFFYVFGALCYPTNDNDDVGKLDAKANIVSLAAAPRVVDLGNSPVPTSIDQDAPSASIPSTQE